VASDPDQEKSIPEDLDDLPEQHAANSKYRCMLPVLARSGAQGVVIWDCVWFLVHVDLVLGD
jgi:hypothetical protein